MVRETVLSSSAIVALLLGANLAMAQQSDQGTQILPPGQAHGTTAGEREQRKTHTQRPANTATGEQLRPMEPGKAPRTGAERAQTNQSEQGQESGSTVPRKPGVGQAASPSGKSSTTATGEPNSGSAPAKQPVAGQQQPSNQPATARTNENQPNRETTGSIPKNPVAGQAPSPSTAGANNANATATANTSAEPGARTATVQGRIQIDPQRAQMIHERLVRTGETERTNVNFDISVGAMVPQDVAPRELPVEVVAEYPQFRGYRYVVVRDEIIIVEPRTRQVVEIIGGGSSRSRHTATSERLRLTAEQRDIIRRNLHRSGGGGSAGPVEFDAEAPLPATVDLAPIPDEVVRDVPVIRSYDYVVTRGDEIVIVDPRTREVLDVID